MICSFTHSNLVSSHLSSLFLNPAELASPWLLKLKPNPTNVVTCTSQPKPQKPAFRGRRKPYGSSRRSVLKKTFTQEQANFTAAIPDNPVVGIIGGGMSGLLCALALESRGVRSTVFDTGKHGLGGRMGTRIIDPQPLIFDHAAQFFTASDPRFAELVQGWSERGLVSEWTGTVGKLEAGGRFSPIPSSPPRFIAPYGMRLLADSILSQASMVDVVRPCWVSKLEPYNGMWYLSENGKPVGKFDAVVIAHNGKCANRLLSLSGLPLIARQMKRLDLSSIWALLAAFEAPLSMSGGERLPFEGAFVKGVDSVSWMGNNTAKLGGEGLDCWTFFSTAAFGKRHKVPQENIPNVTAEKVKVAMLKGVEEALGIADGSLQTPFYTKLQLWGAALPTNTPGIPCIFDGRGRTGICGDWLLGSSLESAALSGMALGHQIADFFGNSGADPNEFSVGLDTEFRPLEGYDIGQFPGMETKKKENEVEEFQLSM